MHTSFGNSWRGSTPTPSTSEAVDNRVVRLPKSTHPQGAGKIIAPILILRRLSLNGAVYMATLCLQPPFIWAIGVTATHLALTQKFEVQILNRLPKSQ